MRTTVTINDNLYMLLKRRVLDTGGSMSQYVQEALIDSLLEDTYDIEEIERRLKEPTISHEQLVKELKAEGLL